jgi:trigger factor
MNVDIEKISGCRQKLTFTIAADEVNAVKADVVKKFVKEGAVAGFRKGKAPQAIIEKKFADKIKAETVDSVAKKYYAETIKEKEIKVFELITFADLEYPTSDDGMVFAAEIDVFPEFDLPKYEGIPVDDKVTEVAADKVDTELKNFAKSFATGEEFTAETVAKEDDMVCISYEATLDGVPLAEAIPGISANYAKNDISWCTIGSKYYMIPGMADALVGKKLGDTGVFVAEYPEDSAKEELRGKKVEYKWTLNKGTTYVTPELTDELVKEKTGAENIDALRTRIKDYFENQAKTEDKERKLQQIYEYISKSVSMELPEEQLKRTAANNLSSLLQMGLRQGANKDELEAEKEKLTKIADERAADRMRVSFVVDAIATKEDIKLTDEEFNKFVMQKFYQMRITEKEMSQIVKDQQKMQMLYSEARSAKVMEFLLEKAKPTAGFGA